MANEKTKKYELSEVPKQKQKFGAGLLKYKFRY